MTLTLPFDGEGRRAKRAGVGSAIPPPLPLPVTGEGFCVGQCHAFAFFAAAASAFLKSASVKP